MKQGVLPLLTIAGSCLFATLLHAQSAEPPKSAKGKTGSGFAEQRPALSEQAEHAGTASNLVKAVVADLPPPSAEAVRLFTTKVQPILTNLCVSCHARRDHASNYRLRAQAEESVNAQFTQDNLAATLLFIDRQSPGGSVFLEKALTAHGGVRVAALDSRLHPAFQHLENWAMAVGVADGTKPVKVTSPGPVIVNVVSQEKPTSRKVDHAATEPTSKTPLPQATTHVGVVRTGFGSDAPVRPLPPAAPNPEDPFDPVRFNRLPANAGK